jgi:hypothetical protein
MKKTVAIFLLLTCVFQSTSTLWILASFYVQRDYISQNICINRFDTISLCKGQCYLSKQLKENEKKEQNFPDLKGKEIQLFFQNNFTFEVPKTTIQDKLNALIYTYNTLSSEFIFSVFHPPQIV